MKRRTFSRLFKFEEQCFIEYIPRIQISASIFSFIIISLSRENVFHIFQISCKSLGQTAIFRPNNFDSKENRSIETVRSLFSSPRELNSRIYGDVSAAEFTWKQLNLFRGNGFIKSGKCLSFIEAPRKAIYNLV